MQPLSRLTIVSDAPEGSASQAVDLRVDDSAPHSGVQNHVDSVTHMFVRPPSLPTELGQLDACLQAQGDQVALMRGLPDVDPQLLQEAESYLAALRAHRDVLVVVNQAVVNECKVLTGGFAVTVAGAVDPLWPQKSSRGPKA